MAAVSALILIQICIDLKIEKIMERWRDAKSLVLWELENQSNLLNLAERGHCGDGMSQILHDINWK